MSLFHAALQPALDSSGNPISGATWNFYTTGTLTPASVYTTNALTTAHGSTVTANSAGRFANVFLDDGVTYRAILKDAGGTTIKDIDPANGGESVGVFASAPSGAAFKDLWTVAPDSLTGITTGDYMRWATSIHTAANQNPGQTPVDNVVVTYGWNVSAGGGRQDTSKPSYSFRYERSFYQSSVMAFEFHEQLDTAAAATYRVRTQFISYDGTVRTQGHTLTRDSWYASDGSTEKVVFNFATDRMDFDNGFYGRQNDNAIPVFSQINAAGNAYISLPYVNARNYITFESPIYQSTATVSNADFGISTASIRNISGMATGHYVDYVTANAVTGDINASVYQQSVTGVLKTTLENQHASGTAVYDLVGANAATGYRVNGTKVVGARNTGWTAMTGTGSKAALAAAAAGTASAAYVQAELQGALNRIAALEARLKSYDDAFVSHGLIGA